MYTALRNAVDEAVRLARAFSARRDSQWTEEEQLSLFLTLTPSDLATIGRHVGMAELERYIRAMVELAYAADKRRNRQRGR